MTHNNKPLISVCIPAYNHEKYIKECLQSIINQTYSNIELIVIDDGSSDRTWNILQEMRSACDKRFIRVVFQYQENQGTCKTFSKLFSIAEGKYVTLIASDDAFLPNALNDLVDFLEQNTNTGLVVGKNLIFDSNSKHCYWDKERNNIYDNTAAKFSSFTDFLEKSSHITTTDDNYGSYESLLKGNYIPNGWVFRKELLAKIAPFTTAAPLEDWWFMLQISKLSAIRAIQKTTFCYRWHEKNTIKQKEKMKLYGRKTIACEFRLLTENHDLQRLELFKKTVEAKKYHFNVSNFMKLYTLSSFNYKKVVLDIMGRKFVLLKKMFL